jgi:hypothetical protein
MEVEHQQLHSPEDMRFNQNRFFDLEQRGRE